MPKGAAFPVAAEAGAVQGKSAMAWRDSTKPKPAGSVPGPAACAQDKNPKRNKTDLEKQSAVATAVAKKGAEAAEAAVRLATLAAKQMAQSLATPQRAAPKERSVELPQWRSRPSSHRVTQCSSNKARAAPRARILRK